MNDDEVLAPPAELGGGAIALPMLMQIKQRQQPKPQTPEEQARVLACFQALEERGVVEGLELALQTVGTQRAVYIYATRMGFPTVDKVFEVAAEFGLKISIMAEQFVANSGAGTLFGEGTPTKYARIGLLVAPPVEYMTDEEAELLNTPTDEIH